MDNSTDMEVKINEDPPKWVCRSCKKRIDKKELIILFHSRDKKQKAIRQHFNCTITAMKGNSFKKRLQIALKLAESPDDEKNTLLMLIK